MKLIALLPLLGCGLIAHAQLLPPTEVFGGYSFLYMKPGASLDRTGLNGWHASATRYVVGRVGLSADISGHYGAADVPGTRLGRSSVDIRQHTFLAGPSVRLFQRPRFATSFRALFGGARGEALDLGSVPPAALALDLTDATKFAASFGSSIDIALSRRVAWRIQPNVLLTRFGADTQRNFRLSTGLVFRLGGE